MVRVTVLGWKMNPEEAVLGRKPLEPVCDDGLGLAPELATSLFDSCMQLFVVNCLFGPEIVLICACL